MRFDAERLRAELERMEDEPELLGRVGARLSALERKRQTPKLFWGLAFASCLVAGLAIFFVARPSQELRVIARIDGSESSIVGRWVKTGEETRQVHFSDGSQLALFPNTEVKVESADPKQTRVRLGEGRTHVHVIHNKATDYRFEAGPFEVRVTGTKFDLAWQSKEKHLELVLLEGGVLVTGPGLEAPRKVGPGEFLQLDAVDPRADGAPDEEARGEEKIDAGADAGADEPSPEISREASAESPRQPKEHALGAARIEKKGVTDPKGPAPANVEGASWQTLLESGQRGAAVRAAEARGAASALSLGSSSSLFALAQAARLEGSPRFARELLLGLRETRGERGQTAFYLGKIAYDQLGNKAEAKKWFETYLREAPTGTFAEQAWARLFELAGSGEQGRKLAREYLERYPSGASSARARSLLH